MTCSTHKRAGRGIYAGLVLSLGGCLLLSFGCQNSSQNPDPTATLRASTQPADQGDQTAEAPATQPEEMAGNPSPATQPMTEVPPAEAPATQPMTEIPAAEAPATQPAIEAQSSETPAMRGVVEAKPASSHEDYTPVQLDPPADAAGAIRHWSASTCSYASGATIVYPTYNVDKPDQPAWLQGDMASLLLDPEILMGEMVFAPFWMVKTPPWTQVVARAIYYPPTMTGFDPLPPEKTETPPTTQPAQMETPPTTQP